MKARTDFRFGARLVFCLLLVFVSGFSLSDTGSLEENPEIIEIISDQDVYLNLDSFSEFYLDSSGQAELLDVINEGMFERLSPGSVRSLRLSETSWYRFSIENKSDEDLNFILKLNNRSINDAVLYQLDPDLSTGNEKFVISTHQVGDYLSFSEREVKAREYVFTFEIKAREKNLFYYQLKDQGQETYKVELVDLNSFFREQMLVQAISFLAMGFALGILIYNLNIYLRTREEVYLSYVLYIVSFAIYFEVQRGSLALFWDGVIPISLRPVLLWTFLFLVLFTFSRLTSSILLIGERKPEWHFWFVLLQIACLSLAFSCLFIPYIAVEYLAQFSIVSVISLCLSAAFYFLYLFRDRITGLYLLSFSPLALIAILLVISFNIEFLQIPYYAELLQIGFCFNMLFLSNGLAHHVKNLSDKQRFYEARLMAAKANEDAKRDFYGKISHEMRTPLNGIIGASELLKDSSLDENQQKYIDILHSSGRTLLNLVNNIVDLSRVESGKMELNEEHFSLKEMLLDIEKIFLLKTLESGIPLVFEISEDLSDVFIGDENRIRQILVNFLSNAYKFTQRGFISVKVSEAANTSRTGDREVIRFEVLDTGIGIAPEKVESIFEDFTQIYTRSSRSNEGSGLGLAICRELTVLLGGEISLESSEGEGSRFILDLPLKRVRQEGEDYPFRVYKNPVLGSKTILIIDKCKHCSGALGKLAFAWGMKAGMVNSLRDALDNIRRSSEVGVDIDLLVLEYSCLENQEGGNHFFSALQRHQSTRTTKTLVVVSQTDIEAMVHLLGGENIFVCQRQAYLRNFEQIFEAVLSGDRKTLQNYIPFLSKGFDELGSGN